MPRKTKWQHYIESKTPEEREEIKIRQRENQRKCRATKKLLKKIMMSKMKKPKLSKWEKRKLKLTKTNGWKSHRHNNKMAQRKCRAKGKAFDADTTSEDSTDDDDYEDDEGTNLENENDAGLDDVVINETEHDDDDYPRRSENEQTSKPATEFRFTKKPLPNCRQPGLSKFQAPSKMKK